VDDGTSMTETVGDLAAPALETAYALLYMTRTTQTAVGDAALYYAENAGLVASAGAVARLLRHRDDRVAGARHNLSDLPCFSTRVTTRAPLLSTVTTTTISHSLPLPFCVKLST
jgi:hypothetical protein